MRWSASPCWKGDFPSGELGARPLRRGQAHPRPLCLPELPHRRYSHRSPARSPGPAARAPGQDPSGSPNPTTQSPKREKKLENKKVDAVAFSLGARILLKLAIRNPAQFRKIVIAGVGDSLFEPDELHGKKIFTAISGNENSDDPESRYFSQLADHPDINGKFIAECLQQEDMSISPAHLNAVNLPVLVVLGDRDFARPATTLIESLPEANLITLKGVDHFATPKDFTFIESALEFLDSAPSW